MIKMVTAVVAAIATATTLFFGGEDLELKERGGYTAQEPREVTIERTGYTLSPAVVEAVTEPTGREKHYEDPEPMDVDPDELDLLARLIYAEAGAEWCSDQMQLAVGSVVLNRMAHEAFPDTMHDVIYQCGQYYCVDSTAINLPANQRAVEAAEKLLKWGTILPEDVVYQAEYMQGAGLFIQVQNMFFCYYGGTQ